MRTEYNFILHGGERKMWGAHGGTLDVLTIVINVDHDDGDEDEHARCQSGDGPRPSHLPDTRCPNPWGGRRC